MPGREAARFRKLELYPFELREQAIVRTQHNDSLKDDKWQEGRPANQRDPTSKNYAEN